MAKLSPFGDAVAGSAGAAFANTLVYPLDVIKTRLQVQTKHMAHLASHQQYNSAWDAFWKIVEQEGISGLYVGLTGGIFGTVAQNFAYFYWYSLIRGSYQKKNPGPLGTFTELALGAIAGAFSQLFTLPIAVVNTRQQTASKKEKRTFFQTMREVVREDGYQGLWKGLTPSLILTVNPAITYGVFERLKTYLLTTRPRAGNALGSGEIFLIGAISKTLATVVTFPYILAKVKLQWKPSKELLESSTKEQIEKLRYKSSLDVLRKVYESDGITGWYKGMKAQIYKAVLNQAILFVTKEQFTLYILALFQLISKLQANAKQVKA
ncbi:peroxisomal adenine nucleotide transporter 1 [Gonapodya prolifera JEL478]|uniref:Peroxisomal adenine nucleotide transporter 1 n=1 Tax=Gonapodya prolifera (strain JEL478) TaxID=1344416 RepID=A0A139A508_GONPJ|nr:peroxisomal adenine nucleotide transporter 1 [Gonapodya prolifera JEL478]|eukprot:KXS11902.1 peroxisomal adenine nucleotide transporter 1 [Gonapodya prolifera JEL478]